MSDNGVKVFRVNHDRPPSAGGGAQAWVRSHRVEAGAGVAGLVAAFALYRRHVANASGSGIGGAAGTAGTAGTDIAGLVSPNTQSTDLQNLVQDQLNAMTSSINAQLANASPPPAPLPAAAAPKPGTFWFGDAAKGLNYYVNPNQYGPGKGQIYQAQPHDGTVTFFALNNQQYTAAGTPKPIPITGTPPKG